MNEFKWGTSLFTSECRTDSCTFYVTQSCDMTQPITDHMPHSVVVTMMNLTQNPLLILFRRICWPICQVNAEREFLEICLRFGHPLMSNTRWPSLHMPGLYVSTWTTQMSPSTCSLKGSSAHVTQSFDELIWDVVCTRLSVAQCECCNNYEAVSENTTAFKVQWRGLAGFEHDCFIWAGIIVLCEKKDISRLDHDRHEKY